MKLYSRNVNGSVQVWWAEQIGDSYIQSYGQLDGKIVTTEPTKCLPKNVGRANETSGEDQAEKEVAALIKKKLKTGYFERLEDIDKAELEPQLAKPCKDYIEKVDWSVGQIVDQKLNGICCVITSRGAFSRRGEQFFAIPHILEELAPFFAENPSAYLHGELFNPEYVNQLNKIAELVAVTRKEKDINQALLDESRRMVQYHLYENYNFGGVVVSDPGLKRREVLDQSFVGFQYVKTIQYKICYSFSEMHGYADAYMKAGGEGVIIRNPLAPYQHKRTKDLLKFKKQESAEFKIISIEEGSANWKGCAKFAWCELPNGIRDDKFKTNIKGSQEELRRVFERRDEYVGKIITVEFQELSPYNVPLIPYSDLLVRDYE